MRKRKKIKPISSSDQVFFQKFYENNKNFMFFISRKYASSQEDCEDIVQETVIRLLNNISSLKELDSCKSAKYIVLTIRTAFLDIEKRKRRIDTVSLDDGIQEALIKKGALISDSMSDNSAYFEVEQLRKELSPRDWLVLEGKYYLGYSQEELGQLIGVAPDSIRMILYRAKEKARKILQQDLKGGMNYER